MEQLSKSDEFMWNVLHCSAPDGYSCAAMKICCEYAMRKNEDPVASENFKSVKRGIFSHAMPSKPITSS